MPVPPQFLFATCQVHAEAVLKRELARKWPDFRFAFSRPGFLTYRLPEPSPLKPGSDLGSIFARAWGLVLGKGVAETLPARCQAVLEFLRQTPEPIAAIHVWERDRYSPGYRGFEPTLTVAAHEAAQALRDNWSAEYPAIPIRPLARTAAGEEALLGFPAVAAGECILDVIVVEPAEWWVGFHYVSGIETTWPGGLLPLELPEHAVSRGYLKMSESLLWSGAPITAGDLCIDLGSAPGGAAQALLDRGLRVVGVDPAEIHPAVLAHPKFMHARRRSKEVPRRLYRDAHWVTTDINLPPKYTLDALEGILKDPAVHLRGLIFTLKLPDWALADEIPGYLKRIRRWGFAHVCARQMQHNRQEICVAVYQ